MFPFYIVSIASFVLKLIMEKELARSSNIHYIWICNTNLLLSSTECYINYTTNLFEWKVSIIISKQQEEDEGKKPNIDRPHIPSCVYTAAKQSDHKYKDVDIQFV